MLFATLLTTALFALSSAAPAGELEQRQISTTSARGRTKVYPNSRTKTPPAATASSILTTAVATTPAAPTSAPTIDVRAASLNEHNSFRAQHAAGPLVWSDLLASKAQQWADACNWGHSRGALGPYGENLAASSSRTPNIVGLIGLWEAEAPQYDPNNPTYSHFTQMVWKSTTQLGCAMAICDPLNGAPFSGQYLVCEYYPPGNVIGQFAQNVS